nr:hypothetical protein CFP56_51602 [Quercus suber]
MKGRREIDEVGRRDRRWAGEIGTAKVRSARWALNSIDFDPILSAFLSPSFSTTSCSSTVLSSRCGFGVFGQRFGNEVSNGGGGYGS